MERLVRQRVTAPADLPAFEIVVASISDFLTPPLLALRDGDVFAGHWSPGGPWAEVP